MALQRAVQQDGEAEAYEQDIPVPFLLWQVVLHAVADEAAAEGDERIGKGASERAVAVLRPKLISNEVCRRAQIAHQETKIRRNLPEESGDLAMCSEQLQHFMGAARARIWSARRLARSI